MKKATITIITTIILFSSSFLFAGYFERGKSYYIYRKYEKAKEMFLKASETMKSGDAYYFLGEIEKLQGNYKEAVEHYKAAISKKNTNRKYLKNAYWNVMILAEQIGDYDSVIKICKEMWLRTKDQSAKKKIETLINKYLWTDNKEAIEKYEKGLKLKRSGKTEKALEMFKSALNIEYNFLAPKFEIGMIAYNRGKLDTALSYLSDVAYKINFYAEVHLIMGNIYYKRRSYSSAIEHFNKVFEFGLISSKTEYFIKIKRGTCYYNTGDYEKAEEDIEKALRYRKNSTKSLLLLSAIRIKQGEYSKALGPLLRANKINPNNPAVLYQIGSIYYKEGSTKYISYFSKLFDIARQRKKYSRKYNKAFMILAKARYKKRYYKSVIAIIKTLGEASDNYDARLLAAKSYFHIKKYDKSIDYFEKISVSGENKFLLCKAYARSGRRQKSKFILAELLYSGDYLKRAKKDNSLAGIVREIEKEKKREEHSENDKKINIY